MEQKIGKYQIKFSEIDISLVYPNKWNPNLQSEEIFKKEIQSIKEFGFIDPILVREIGGVYQIIDGEHRFKACKELGFQKIKIGSIGEVSDEEAKFLTLQMNNLRGKDDVLKRAQLLKEINEGQLQLLPFSKSEIDFEMKLLDFDFSKFDNIEINKKEIDPLKEAYNHLVKTHILFGKIYEESKNRSLRLFIEKFNELLDKFKQITEF